MGGVQHLVVSGPLVLAIPVAAAAGAVTFLSPCVLPLVPGYLSYVTGMSGADADRTAGRPAAAAAAPVTAAGGGAGTTVLAARSAAPAAPARYRTVAGTALFVLGFSAVFASEGVAFGGIGTALKAHSTGLNQILGGLAVLLGLMFAGVFDRFPITGRVIRPSVRPRAGLAGAPLLGVLFGVSWTPCIGPTLGVAMSLAMTAGTAGRGALLMFAYGLGLGVPFLVVALAFQRSMTALAVARRHARAITRIGGALLIAVGVAELTGAWTSMLTWLQVHWLGSYQTPL